MSYLKTTRGAAGIWLWLCIFSSFQATLADRYWFTREFTGDVVFFWKDFQTLTEKNRNYKYGTLNFTSSKKRENLARHLRISFILPFWTQVFPSFIRSLPWIGFQPRGFPRAFQGAIRCALPLQKAIDELPIMVLFFAYHLVAMRMLNPSSYEGLNVSRDLAVGSWLW